MKAINGELDRLVSKTWENNTMSTQTILALVTLVGRAACFAGDDN
jgi:hypothetical protein